METKKKKHIARKSLCHQKYYSEGHSFSSFLIFHSYIQPV